MTTTMPRPDDAMALHETLNAAAAALNAAESGNRDHAGLYLTVARTRAATAYPLTSPGAAALNWLLASLTAEVTATQGDRDHART